MTYSDPSFWKWVCGALIALATTNGLTAFLFRTDEQKIYEAVRRTFTEVSNQYGMYAIEGRPRLEALERSRVTLAADMNEIHSALARIEAKLEP